MLEVKELRKKYGEREAVRSVSFKVERGEVLGFLGPNGAGKTTTMRMITGFIPPTSGTAVIEGYDILQNPISAKKKIGYLPENSPLYAEMTVENYLSFIADVRGLTGEHRKSRLKSVIELCQLEDVYHQQIGTLSKGYKHRVGFAQAILHDPPVLIMDEPTDGLDPNQKHVVRSIIKEMALNKIIVLSTHILEEVDAVCTRAMIIKEGIIVANGSPEQLKARSRWHGAIEICFKTLPPNALARFSALSSASKAELSGENKITVFPKDVEKLSPDVLSLVKANPDWQIAQIKTLEGRLDEVFRELTISKN
jgi:ABC-2 type transport system ATP-binding protein